MNLIISDKDVSRRRDVGAGVCVGSKRQEGEEEQGQTSRFGACQVCGLPRETMTGTRTGGEEGAPNILVALYVATAGLQGNALGSDEEEITLLVYVLINELQNKVTTERRETERRKEGEVVPRRKWFATDELIRDLTRDLSFFATSSAFADDTAIIENFCRIFRIINACIFEFLMGAEKSQMYYAKNVESA